MRELKASVGQRLLWLLASYKGHAGALNCPVVCRFDGPMSTAHLTLALERLSGRHESLRTTFVRRDRQLRQLIHAPRALALEEVDLREGGAASLSDALHRELRTNIDPTVWPVRARLFRVSDATRVLCLNLHHLITDTWSCGVLQRELAEEYQRASAKLPNLPRKAWQFSQFMAFQERNLAGEGFARQRTYWNEQLSGARPPELPLRASNLREAPTRSSVLAHLDPATAKALDQLATAQRTTLFVVALAVYYALLERRTGGSDIAVSTLFANRLRPETLSTVGFLANLVVLRTLVRRHEPFVELVRRTRTTVLDALANQELPFHVASQGVTHGESVRMDDIVFQMLAEPLDERLQASDVTVSGVIPDVAGRFDFELALMPCAQGIAVKLFFSERRADRAFAENLVSDYVALAQKLVACPELRLDAPAAAELSSAL